MELHEDINKIMDKNKIFFKGISFIEQYSNVIHSRMNINDLYVKLRNLLKNLKFNFLGHKTAQIYYLLI